MGRPIKESMREQINKLFNARADKFKLIYIGEGSACIQHLPTKLVVDIRGNLAATISQGFFENGRVWLEVTRDEQEALTDLYRRVTASMNDKRHAEGMIRSDKILQDIFKL